MEHAQSSCFSPTFDLQKQAQACAMLAVGCSLDEAARFVGCSVGEIRQASEQQPAFTERLREAERAAQTGPLDELRQAIRRNWRAAAWLLARFNPNRTDRCLIPMMPLDLAKGLVGFLSVELMNALPSQDAQDRVLLRARRTAQWLFERLPNFGQAPTDNLRAQRRRHLADLQIGLQQGINRFQQRLLERTERAAKRRAAPVEPNHQGWPRLVPNRELCQEAARFAPATAQVEPNRAVEPAKRSAPPLDANRATVQQQPNVPTKPVAHGEPPNDPLATARIEPIVLVASFLRKLLLANRESLRRGRLRRSERAYDKPPTARIEPNRHALTEPVIWKPPRQPTVLPRGSPWAAPRVRRRQPVATYRPAVLRQS